MEDTNMKLNTEHETVYLYMLVLELGLYCMCMRLYPRICAISQTLASDCPGNHIKSQWGSSTRLCIK